MNGEMITAGEAEAAQALSALHAALRDCSRCALHRSRTQVVFGAGNPRAELLFVGEGPGFNEDKQGEPFVGQAGKLLTELLTGIGLSRADVYIANVVKCRPPENRDPAPDEIEACSPHLMEQIAIIKPRVICTLGRFATKLLADTNLSMTLIHGKAKTKELAGVETIIFPVFHPAAALYTPANRQVLEEDFGRLRRLLDLGLEALTPSVTGDPIGDNMESGVDAGMQTGASTGVARAASTVVGRRTEPKVEQLPLW